MTKLQFWFVLAVMVCVNGVAGLAIHSFNPAYLMFVPVAISVVLIRMGGTVQSSGNQMVSFAVRKQGPKSRMWYHLFLTCCLAIIVVQMALLTMGGGWLKHGQFALVALLLMAFINGPRHE